MVEDKGISTAANLTHRRTRNENDADYDFRHHAPRQPPSSPLPNPNRKHSGRHTLGKRCEQLGFQLAQRELDLVYKKFVALADCVKVVNDRELLRIIEEELPHTAPVRANSCRNTTWRRRKHGRLSKVHTKTCSPQRTQR